MTSDKQLKQAITRKMVVEHVKLGKSIREIADSCNMSYSGVWNRLHSDQAAPIIKDVEDEVLAMAADAQLFIRVNYGDYIREMDTMARGTGREKFKANAYLLDRLMPVVQQVAHQVKHELSGEAVEQFTATMETMDKVLKSLPKPGAIENDPHLLQGDAALPRPGAVDVDYSTDD